jgi:hypothetical protein
MFSISVAFMAAPDPTIKPRNSFDVSPAAIVAPVQVSV